VHGDLYGGHFVMGVLVGAKPIIATRKTMATGEWFVAFDCSPSMEMNWVPWPLEK
jgi:hypothetical protein